MKYIFIAKRKGIELASNYVDELKAGTEWIKSRQSSGVVEAAYGFIPDGGFAISNYNSHEEAWADLISYPLYKYSDWKVKPIIDIHKMFDKITKMMS